MTEVGRVIDARAFERLVWANAGVARDFLQMFGRALEHASEKGRRKITLTDANLAIGEFGDQKMHELEQDAQNDKSQLEQCLAFVEKYCLEGSRGIGGSKTNGFLIRNDSSAEFRAVQALKDLRLVHLLHQTITPSRAGERYEAYIIDYSRFTGFRRRQNIQEIKPGQGKQFQAKELRKLPPLPPQFLQRLAAA